MSKANEPAFPVDIKRENRNEEVIKSHWGPGLSKREYAAIKAMQGFAANPNAFVEWDNKRIAQESVLLADALLAELEK